MIDGKENVLSKTLAKMNPRLFSHPLFRNYYLKLFYDVTFSTGVRGLYTPCHQVLRGNREKAVIDYDHMSFFRISYINYDQRTSRTLELQKEQEKERKRLEDNRIMEISNINDRQGKTRKREIVIN